MRIALVDFSHLLSVNFHARANDGGPNYAAEATMTELSGLRQHFDRVIVCYDRKPYFRRDLYPEYKAKREEAAPELIRLWKLCAEKVEREYRIAKADGFEADDCCATLAKAYSEMGHTVEIVGADKDALQCVRDSELNKREGTLHGPVSVRVLGHGVADEIRGTQFVRDKYGVEPHQFALAQAIMGDKGDNIPGIARMGQKAAAKLISLYTGEWDATKCIQRMRIELANQVTAANEPGAKPLPAFWRDFAAGHIKTDSSPGLELMLQLTTLRTDVPLDAEALLEPKDRVSQPVPASMQSAPDDDDVDEPDWDAIAEQTEAEQAAQAANDDNGAALKKALEDFDGMTAPKTQPKEADYAPALKGVRTDTAQQTLGAGAGTRESGAAGSDPGPAPADNSPKAAYAAALDPKVDVCAKPAEKQSSRGSESEAIVVDQNDPRWRLQLNPTTPRQLDWYAKVLWDSGLVRQFNSAPGVLAVATLGRELGLGMMASLMGFHVIQDKPFAKWDTLLALCERDPRCEWFIVEEMTNDRCIVATKKRGYDRVLRHEYTRELAEQAGYFTGKNAHNWNTRTRNMLRARAVSEGSHMWYPGAVMGIHTVEEAGDYE